MLSASTLTALIPPRPRDGLALMTREECAAWQIAAERIALRHEQTDRTLEFALAALHYAVDGAAPAEALGLAEALLFGERGMVLR